MRTTIQHPKEVIVMNGWLHHLLGDLQTKTEAQIKICNLWLGKFRASTYHPQIIVRVAAWLGLISIGLGLLGGIFGIVSLVK
ncbi:hypothetical protein LCGC14_0942850 [marine sediment metagenome]|uniref:Uncharacterized protein n=1 Tax=marine sediment metagenome TaxID=412755 RepID=A0A0F9R375_9ZZZZ|nr:hypothetical protein [Methylophaga sp.]HEC59007.1 hypothetical protein [Methylophaga sp.]